MHQKNNETGDLPLLSEKPQKTAPRFGEQQKPRFYP